MTQQEQQLLNGLMERVNGTQLQSKDSEAEQLLQSALGKNPDALYVLSQTVLVQQFAMENAQKQLTEARAEIERLQTAKPQEHGSFLGNLFGLGKNDEPAPQPLAPPASPTYQAGYAGAPTGYAPVRTTPPPMQYAPQQPVQQQPGYGYGQPGYGYGGAAPIGGGMFGGSGGVFGGGGGFMQGAMQTAAGVVAGEFAFKAIEGMFHSGGERGFGGGSEVVNNYYDNDSSNTDSGGLGDRLRDADGLGGGISSDIEDRRGESHGFFGRADDNTEDASGFADSGNDDAADFSDNSSGFDDGGSSGNDDNGF